MKSKWMWRIEGFDGSSRIFHCDLPNHFLSKGQMEELLRRLASQHLTCQEVVAASLNKKGKPTTLLDVQRMSSLPLVMTCGSNPHFTASAVEST